MDQDAARDQANVTFGPDDLQNKLQQDILELVEKMQLLQLQVTQLRRQPHGKILLPASRAGRLEWRYQLYFGDEKDR